VIIPFFDKFIARFYYIIKIGVNFLSKSTISKNIKAIHIIKNVKKIKTKIFNIIYHHNLYYSSKKTVKTEFIDYILAWISEPEVILDLGSQNAKQSIEFSTLFPRAKIFAFECNPPSIEKCIENIRNLKNIEIVPKAVFNKDGFMKFYPVISNNMDGASSLFKSSGKYDHIVKLPQKEIVVETTRIATWANKKNIYKIDLCWMDLQGAEYETLEGMDDLIFTVQAMFVEVVHQELYSGQKLFKEIVAFLEEKGFSMIKYFPVQPEWYGNAIFLNNNLKKNN